MSVHAASAPYIIKSIGRVSGDIGTSPVWGLTVLFMIIPPTPENAMVIVSLIIWTMTIPVTIAYVFLAVSRGWKGGGAIMLPGFRNTDRYTYTRKLLSRALLQTH
jgi:K+ transporter